MAFRVTVVGAGTMGEMHARVVATSDRAVLADVLDIDARRRFDVASKWGAVGGDCDAAIIATPTHRHADEAVQFLEAGIPVLVEKPLADEPAQVKRIIRTAELTGTPLMCGFVERFNPAVLALHTLLDEPVVHILAVRHSPPAPRINGSVVTDLLIHDLDLATRLIPGDASVTAAGTRDTADCTARFESGIATLSASRNAQRKVRTVNVNTANVGYELDLLRQNLTVYRHLSHDGDRGGYRADTAIGLPFVSGREPLAAQFDHFLDLAQGKADPAVELASILPAHQLAAQITPAQAAA